MAVAPFFDRIYGAVGMYLSVSRESLSSKLASITVGMSCGDSLDENERNISELAINIVARLYPRIAISGDKNTLGHLKAIALGINPEIEFQSSSPPETTISVASSNGADSLYPAATGWVAKLSHSGPQESGTANPYASGMAACLACSELFRRVFLKSSPEPDLSISLLDFGTTTGAAIELKAESIGDVLFIGLGAVGNSAIWALSKDHVTYGHLRLMDPELLTLSNLQRYVLGSMALVGQRKTEIASEALSSTQFSITSYDCRIEDFKVSDSWSQPATTCVSVDNVIGRRVAQALLPRLVVNGWTGEGSLGASWHEFSRDQACLACLYHPHGQGVSSIQQAARAFGISDERAALLWVTRAPLSDEERMNAAKHLGVKPLALKPWKDKAISDLYTDVVCGAVPIDVRAAGRIEVVPLAHQSALAGILLAAELLKRTQPYLTPHCQPEPLVAWDNVLQKPPRSWIRPRPRELGCICGDLTYQSVYREKWT